MAGNNRDPFKDGKAEQAAVRAFAHRFNRGGDADADIEAWLKKECASGNGFSVTNPRS